MHPKRFIFVFVVLSLFVAGVFAEVSQEKKSALEPENYNEARLNRLQPPDQVMDAIGIVPGMVLAEVGAGRGRYVMHLAHRVGESGKVYAEDIDAAALKYLEKRCERWDIKNVETILGDVTDPKLPEGELDLIFIISAYHHFSDPVALLRNARPALRPNGKLAIVEWLPRNENDKESSALEQIETQMNAAGYKLERIENFLRANRIGIYIFRTDVVQ